MGVMIPNKVARFLWSTCRFPRYSVANVTQWFSYMTLNDL